jgi:Fe-S-cluster containining protein
MNCPPDCGACCTRIILQWEGDIDTAWLRAHGGKLAGRHIILPIACEHYDAATHTCRIYEARPRSCQKFQCGGRECIMCRHSKGIYIPLPRNE